jgi:hypothetical protein
MNTLICPYTPTCIIYKNWTEKTKDKRVNVILDVPLRGYSCLALIAHDDCCGEGGITFDSEILGRIKTPNVEQNLNLGNVGCSHITLLNKL